MRRKTEVEDQKQYNGTHYLLARLNVTNYVNKYAEYKQQCIYRKEKYRTRLPFRLGCFL